MKTDSWHYKILSEWIAQGVTKPAEGDAKPPGAVPALVWDMNCLESFQELAPVRDDSVPADIIQSFAAWQCSAGAACPELADGTCIKWHDERELRFAQVGPHAPKLNEILS